MGVGPEQQHSFDCLKARMATPEVMKYFNPSLKTELIVDASPVGLGAILTQVTADGGTNIVTYASCSLTDCESHCSQTSKLSQEGLNGVNCLVYNDGFLVS